MRTSSAKVTLKASVRLKRAAANLDAVDDHPPGIEGEPGVPVEPVGRVPIKCLVIEQDKATKLAREDGAAEFSEHNWWGAAEALSMRRLVGG